MSGWRGTTKQISYQRQQCQYYNQNNKNNNEISWLQLFCIALYASIIRHSGIHTSSSFLWGEGGGSLTRRHSHSLTHSSSLTISTHTRNTEKLPALTSCQQHTPSTAIYKTHAQNNANHFFAQLDLLTKTTTKQALEFQIKTIINFHFNTAFSFKRFTQ